MSTAQPFEERFEVRWSDLDANRHMRNTIFSEYATHTRFKLLEQHGFSQDRFASLKFGPVMFREEIRYRREVVMGETVTVNLCFSGLSEDGSHWKAVQEVIRANGKQAAVLQIQGGWIHLEDRKLITPPAELLPLLQRFPRSRNFAELPTLIRRTA